MNIVLVSSEVDPLAKVGGLADVAGALPAALRKLGDTVSVIMPFYGAMDRSRFKVKPSGARVKVWMGGSFREGEIWEHRRKGVPVYLIANPEFYEREGIYGVSGSDYPDNSFRYAFLARAALEAARALGLRPDVFHVNDWQTALLPVYQKVFYREDPVLGSAGVVLSIHNLAYQGLFAAETLPQLGLPWEIFHLEGLEFYGKLNLLKGGMVFSEILSTVSPTYAREIQSTEFGCGLDGVLRRRAADLVGILNGIDTAEWNPGKDPALFAPFTPARPAGKATNKSGLQKSLGLKVSKASPLLGLIGRLDPQKGFDLVVEAAPSLLAEGAQMVLLGSGRREYLDAFRGLKSRFPEQLSLNEGFQADLARRIYAGADIFLMPSRFEPCGLGQMIALRYGAIPVVRRTGGLADTITDADAAPDRGNGFVFESYEPAALLDALRRAISRFGDGKSWSALVSRGMRQDFSWKRSSERYLELYARAARKARGK